MSILRLLSFCYLLTFCISCSPCKRLERLALKYPECFQVMKTFNSDSGTFQLAIRDSSDHKADSTLSALRDTVYVYLSKAAGNDTSDTSKNHFVKSLKLRLGDQFKQAGKTISSVIADVPCLSDTQTYSDDRGTILKFWQVGRDIKFSIVYPTTNYTSNYEGRKAFVYLPWWGWFIFGFLFSTVVTNVVGSKKR